MPYFVVQNFKKSPQGSTKLTSKAIPDTQHIFRRCCQLYSMKSRANYVYKLHKMKVIFSFTNLIFFFISLSWIFYWEQSYDIEHETHFFPVEQLLPEFFRNSYMPEKKLTV